MPFAELAAVSHLVRLGQALPFNVRAADDTLLLARGRTVVDQDQLQALFRRGARVDLADLASPADAARMATRQQMPALWQQGLERLSQTLQASDAADFAGALDAAAAPLQTLIERDPDLAIFHVLRAGGHADVGYGSRRSLQAAITALLVAQRLGWDQASCERAFKVALTMNVSMLDLQGALSRQQLPPSNAQRMALQTHPMRSVRLLEQGGVRDAIWLRAVLQHHEQEDGHGYPSGCSEIGEIASLARRADVYTSKLASRSSRAALAADIAGRQMFMQDPGHPMTAALVKEFGIYPPGTFVRLADGSTAVVVARSAHIAAPRVAVLADPQGRSLAQPEPADTTQHRHAVVAVVGEPSLPQQPSMAVLAALVAS